MRIVDLAKLLLAVIVYVFSHSAFSDDLDQKIQSIVNRDRLKYGLPALSVSVLLPGELISRDYVSGYYTFNDENKISPKTLFQIGSITKTFTASIIMQLIEKDQLNLNDRVGQLLPQYPHWRDVRIKNLLNHSSGIYNYTHGKDFDAKIRQSPNKYWTLAELANLAYAHDDAFKPGEKSQYSNTDYILLGLIIEKITHQPLQTVFNHYLNRYHVKNTFYTPDRYPKNILPYLAHGYNQDGTLKINEDITFMSMSFMQSSGAMLSTPHDLVNWLHALFSGQIVSKQSLANMQELIPIKQNNTENALFTEVGSGLGMGMVYFQDSGNTWVHAGGSLGYESFYAYNPDKNFYVALCYNLKPKKQLIFIKIYEDIIAALPNIQKKRN